LAACAVIGAAYGGAILWGGVSARLSQWEHLRLREVTLSGTVRLSRDEVRRALNLPEEPNLWSLNLKKLRDDLVRHPGIRAAFLHKEFPDRLSVRIEERRPAMAVEGRYAWAVTDEEGAIIRWSADPPPNLPRLRGPDPAVLHHEERITLDRTLALVAAAGARSPIEVIWVKSGPPSYTVEPVVEWYGYRVWFAMELDDHEQWARFRSVEPELNRDWPDGAEVDLRFPGQVVVRPRTIIGARVAPSAS
jgi:hypothetical protein